VKYSNRIDRDIRNTIRKTAPYPSRKSIKNNHRVTRFVEEFASGLSGYNDAVLLDKYYMPGHIPTRDIMTELGDAETTTTNKVSFGLLLLALFLLLRS
jgi:hypothetical protein